MSRDVNYFGLSILAMGKWIDRAQMIGYLGRVSLMGLGLMCLEFLMVMNFDLDEIFNVLHLFSGKIIEGGDGTAASVAWVLFGGFLVHVFAFYILGIRKFKTTINGDEVAGDLFDDMNVSLMNEESEA